MNYKKFIVSFIFLHFVIFDLSEGSTGTTGWIIFRKAQLLTPNTITTICAVSNDLSGMLNNPSVVSTIKQKEIFTIVELGLTEDKVAGVIYAHPFKNFTISAGMLNYDTGKTILYWVEDGQEQQRTVTAQNDILGMVSYGRALTEKLYAGITAKFATSNVAETATANAFANDIGLLYFTTKSLVFSIAVQNLGVSTKFLNKTENLPTSICFAVGDTKSFSKGLYLSGGFDLLYMLYESRITSSIVIEGGKPPVSLFIGYKFNVEETMFNIGLYLTIKQFNLSYSFAPSRWLNSVHRITFGVRF